MGVFAQWSNEPWFSWSGWIFGLISILLSIVFFIKGRKKKILHWTYNTNIFIDNKQTDVEELTVLFNGEQINRLFVTTLEIKNVGNQFISSNDIYEDHPLTIKAERDAGLLFTKVMSESNDTIKCKIHTIDDSETLEKIFQLSFDTFEVKDSVSVSIYHTEDRNTKFDVDGRIRGGKIVDLVRRGNRIARIVLGMFCVFLGVIFTLLGLIIHINILSGLVIIYGLFLALMGLAGIFPDSIFMTVMTKVATLITNIEDKINDKSKQ